MREAPALPSPPPACLPPPSQIQVLTGDWANVLRDLRRIEGLGGGEVRDAAARWLQPSNVFKGFILSA